MMMRVVVPITGAFLLALGSAAWADELRGTVSNIDTKARTFNVGGETIYVPAGMDMTILEGGGPNFDVIYTKEGGRNVLQQITTDKR
jgi:hypothetical protein